MVERITEVEQHVPAARAADAVDQARRSSCDAVVSIGGGSATGLAKIVALRVGLPVVAVPTTFAGSEATSVWGLTEDGAKTTGTDPVVLPKAVVYDATLFAELPRELAIASGLNAVAHAVDGFWAPHTDPINRALGTEGLAALIPALRALHRGGGQAAVEETLFGAYLAALAFASAGSGLHHKICHVLGGRFRLPHAEMHAVVLAYVVAFNAPPAPDAARRISSAFDGAAPGEALDAFRRELGATASLGDLGLRHSDVPEAAQLVLAALPAAGPRPVTPPDVEQILHAAIAGDRVQDLG